MFVPNSVYKIRWKLEKIARQIFAQNWGRFTFWCALVTRYGIMRREFQGQQKRRILIGRAVFVNPHNLHQVIQTSSYYKTMRETPSTPFYKNNENNISIEIFKNPYQLTRDDAIRKYPV